jgi:hypothetical protein
MLDYNVFRARERAVYCAVPADRPVPTFIRDHGWEFAGKTTDDPRSEITKDVRATRINRFHLFRIRDRRGWPAIVP